MTEYEAKHCFLKDTEGNYVIPYTDKQDSLTTTQLNAVDSGITSNKVSNYDTHIDDTTKHITSAERTTWNGKQDTLTSGTNIKTINNQSLLGSGNISISGGAGTITGITMNGASKGTSGVVDLGTVITEHQDISGKQDTLVSGTNIKTINNESIVGSGNISISGGGASINDTTASTSTVYSSSKVNTLLSSKQNSLTLVYTPVLITDYVSGTSGYRIWSNGYCEQWGSYTTSGSGAAITFTVSFSKTMANTNYLPICNYCASSDNQYGQCYSLTTSGMTIKGYKGKEHRWRIFGYLASDQY